MLCRCHIANYFLTNYILCLRIDLDNLINKNQNAPRNDVEVYFDTIYSIINRMSNGRMAGSLWC
jgi:hypothetical protein